MVSGNHPRFFVPSLGLAVKPNRLLFPAFVPAVSAGFRLFRAAGRVSVRESLRWLLPVRETVDLELFDRPFRCPHAGAVGLAVRAPFDPLAGRLPLPFEREPLVELEAAWALFRGRAPDDRASAVVRRTARPVEAVCAGLRSREDAAGRLKWGRAAAGFPAPAGLRWAGVRKA